MQGCSYKRDLEFCVFPLKANGYQLRLARTASVQVRVSMRDYALPSVGRVGEGGYL
jgi:hypothetical protein